MTYQLETQDGGIDEPDELQALSKGGRPGGKKGEGRARRELGEGCVGTGRDGHTQANCTARRHP